MVGNPNPSEVQIILQDYTSKAISISYLVVQRLNQVKCIMIIVICIFSPEVSAVDVYRGSMGL